MTSAFTASPEPLPDRFRLQDIWRHGTGGRLYRVTSIERRYAILQPFSGGVASRVLMTSVAGFQRTAWGGFRDADRL